MSASKLGRYDIERELGHGGMAVVYLARDPNMKRQVAIKVLPRQFTFDPQFRTRFQREAEVIAALEHPFIVPVYDYGEHDDQPYIVMRYMPGGALLDRMQRGLVPLPDTFRILSRLADALDEAHERHIIHRDLKPGNVLFDARGEAFLSDFGIAKLAEASGSGTGTGVLGTPAYMSPEQARGIKELDGRSDVYSLGVILFELVTGRLPYHADTPMGLAVAHITQPVPSIMAVKPDLAPGWEGVIARALAKDPDERYATATSLARAVEALAAGNGSAPAPLVTLTTAPPISTVASVTAAPPTPTTLRPLNPEMDLARFSLARVIDRQADVTGVAFGPDGRWLASAGDDKLIQLLEIESQRTVRLFKGHASGITGLAVSGDGSWLASASLDNTVRVWKAATGQSLFTLTAGANIVPRSVAFSPDGRWLAAGHWDKTVRVWATSDGQPSLTLEGHASLVNAVAFSPDGRWLASGSHDRTVRLWDAASGQLVKSLAGHTGIVSCLAFGADALTLVSGGLDKTVRVWDVAGGQLLATLEGHLEAVTSVACGPDGRAVASASSDKTVRLWDSQRPRHTLTGHSGAVKCVAFSPDGRQLASGGADRTVRLWEIV